MKAQQHNEKYSEQECLIIWKSPESEIQFLMSLLGRSEGALKAVYRVKEETISGKRSKFFRPEHSNPERFFLDFQRKNISFLE